MGRLSLESAMGITLNTTTRGGDPKDKGRTTKTTKSQLSLEGAKGTPRSQPLIHGSALTRECHGNNAAHHIHPSVGKALTWECRGVTLTPHPLNQGSALAWVPWEQRGTSHSRIRGWTTQPDIREKKKKKKKKNSTARCCDKAQLNMLMRTPLPMTTAGVMTRLTERPLTEATAGQHNRSLLLT